MSKAKLKKHMLSMTKEQVVDVMLELYSVSKEAKSWLEFYLEPDVQKELEKYKKAIRNQFFSWNGYPKDPSFRECNKLVSSFMKLYPDPQATADLMLYYVEQGCELTRQVGDYDTPFYTAVENNFNKAMKFISEHGLDVELYPRIKKMIDSVNCCGYGFTDNLWEIYREHT